MKELCCLYFVNNQNLMTEWCLILHLSDKITMCLKSLNRRCQKQIYLGWRNPILSLGKVLPSQECSARMKVKKTAVEFNINISLAVNSKKHWMRELKWCRGPTYTRRGRSKRRSSEEIRKRREINKKRKTKRRKSQITSEDFWYNDSSWYVSFIIIISHLLI